MKAKIIILSALLVCGLQSCEVTDRVPEDAITDLNYWTKVEDLKIYARYFYTTLLAPPGGTSGYLDGMSDITVPQAPPSRFFETWTTIPSGDDGWSKDDWANIRRCNYFMARYQTVTGDAKEINHYVGEIRFFRANEYFSKVKRFGDVPWYDKDLQTNDTELLYKGRDSRLLVIGKIIEDLEFAAANMKTPAQASSGQLHQYCAYQMLSRVCLYEATWQKYRGAAETVWKPLMEKAAAAAKYIMDNGGYSIEKGEATHTMNGNYPLNYKSKFIQEDLTADKEAILSRVYIKEQAVTNELGRNHSFGLSKDFIEQFLCIDGKPIAVSSEYKGDDSIIMEIENRDPRLWNILMNRHVPSNISDGVPVSNHVEIPGGSSETQNATGYISGKFQDPDPLQWVAASATRDWYIFRYAETLLNYAEAKYELGECDQTVLNETINKLRARLDYTDAGSNVITMGRLTENPDADPLAIVNGQPRYGYAIEPLLYEIRRERCIELAFEGFRWDDICRWKAGNLINNPKTMYGMVVNDDVVAVYTKYNHDSNPFTNFQTAPITDWDGSKKLLRAYATDMEAKRKWNDKYYLDPLPERQTKLNPNLLPQNPGWE